jgi:NAD(P)-dependent dehydrogenase (short-subunit alcohol dehydrogenase family)
MTNDGANVALVTGAGRGIGRATALRLAADGMRVMAASRTEAELAETASLAAGIEYVGESVATPEGCARIIEETHRRLGPIDVLVNNAGVGTAQEPDFWDLTPEMWQSTLATNLHGPFELSRRAIRDMMERRWGRIVITSSTAGEHSWPRMTAYSASKHGALGLMRGIAQDAGRFNITCNAVLPGWVRTRMAEDSARLEAEQRGVSIDEVFADWATEYPPGRLVTTEEVANLIAFLASEEASGINGEPITIALGIT